MDTYQVRLPNGKVVSKQLPPGLADADVQAAFLPDYRNAGFKSAGAVVRPTFQQTIEDYWRSKSKGSISEYNPGLGEKLTRHISDGLAGLGVDRRHANRLGEKFLGLLDWTPVGNATAFADANSDFERQLAMLPGPVARKARGMFAGIRAWHGSPHDFDRFDISKIGTGEGAQAYGHGLYFAEARDVAEEYQRKLAPTRVEFRGEPLDEPRKWWATKDQLEADGNWRVGKALEQLHSWGRQGYDTETALRYMRNEHRNSPQMLEAVDELAKQVSMSKAPGRLYEVNINAEPEDFLDWDAPLVEQPKARNALREIDLSSLKEGNRTRRMLEMARDGSGQADLATGRELLNAISDYGERRANERSALLPHGLFGVKYLDQGSRGLGQGSRNYVVFDDSLIDILNKY